MLETPALADPDARRPRRSVPVWALTSWPVLVAAAAIGTLVVGYSYRLSASGAAPSEYYVVFWVGMVVAVLPVGAKIAAPSSTAAARAWAVALIGFVTFVPKYLRNPTAPSYHDEYAHWREAVDVLATGQLFQRNSIIPIIQFYPTTSALTAAVQRLTGLSIWMSGEVVLFVPHLLVLFGVFVLAQTHLGSARSGGIAALIYALNPSAVYFDTQYSYEGIAIAMFVWVLALTSLAARTSGRRRLGFVVAAVVCAGGSVVTHHLTTLFLVLCLAWVALLVTVRARRMARAPRGSETPAPSRVDPAPSRVESDPVPDDTVVLESVKPRNGWFSPVESETVAIPKVAAPETVRFATVESETVAIPRIDAGRIDAGRIVAGKVVAEPAADDRGTWIWWTALGGTVVVATAWIAAVAWATISYLSPYFGGSVGQLSSIAAKADTGRVLLAPSVQPLWERGLTALAPVVVGLFCLRALSLMRHEHRSFRSDTIALMAFGLVYFPSVVFLLAPSGAEGARRSWAFSYVGLALIGAFVVNRARTSGRYRLPHRWLGPAGLAVLAVLLVGNVGGGLNDPYRFPGPFRWGTDTNSASPEARTVARALAAEAGAVRVVSDRYTGLQLVAYGGLSVAQPSAGFPAWELVQTPDDPSADLAKMLFESRYDYLVVDVRMGQQAAFNGDNFGSGDLFQGRPTPMAYLDRLDEVPWASRIMATPNVRVYRLDLLLLGETLRSGS